MYVLSVFRWMFGKKDVAASLIYFSVDASTISRPPGRALLRGRLFSAVRRPEHFITKISPKIILSFHHLSSLHPHFFPPSALEARRKKS